MKFNINGEILNIENVTLNARLQSAKFSGDSYKLFIVCAKGQINSDDVPVLYRKKSLKRIKYWMQSDGSYPYNTPDNLPYNKSGWIRPRIENESYRYLEFHLEKANKFCTDTEDYWEIVPDDFSDFAHLCHYARFNMNPMIKMFKELLAFELVRNNQKILNPLKFKICFNDNDSNFDNFMASFGIRII